MKNSLLLLSLLCYTMTFSQSNQLEDHTWYLEQLIIDGETYINPAPHNELEQVIADFSEEGFQTMICGALMANLDYDDSQSSFSIEYYSQTMENCVSSENLTFENKYFNEFFLLNENPIEEIVYNYSFSQVGTDMLLTIENAIGYQAIYRNDFLSSNTFKSKDLAIYPNPSENHFSIEGVENLTIEHLQVYDLQGNLVKTFNHKSENRYDISALNSGVYILKINKEKATFVQKLIVK